MKGDMTLREIVILMITIALVGSAYMRIIQFLREQFLGENWQCVMEKYNLQILYEPVHIISLEVLDYKKLDSDIIVEFNVTEGCGTYYVTYKYITYSERYETTKKPLYGDGYMQLCVEDSLFLHYICEHPGIMPDGYLRMEFNSTIFKLTDEVQCLVERKCGVTLESCRYRDAKTKESCEIEYIWECSKVDGYCNRSEEQKLVCGDKVYDMVDLK